MTIVEFYLYKYINFVYLQETANLSRSDTALCMSILAAADLASRLTLPTITDKLKVSCRMIFLIGAILLTCTRAILAETADRYQLIIISAIYGYVRAATVVNQNLTISEYTSQDKLAGALGLNMITKGFLVITVGQFLGKNKILFYKNNKILNCFLIRLDT